LANSDLNLTIIIVRFKSLLAKKKNFNGKTSFHEELIN